MQLQRGQLSILLTVLGWEPQCRGNRLGAVLHSGNQQKAMMWLHSISSASLQFLEQLVQGALQNSGLSSHFCLLQGNS